MNRYAHSHEVARNSGSNFYTAFYFLPRDKRNAILSIYAFCRLVDDTVDEAPDLKTARHELALWRKRLELCFDFRPKRIHHRRHQKTNAEFAHPILPELKETFRRFRMSKRYFVELLDGVEMDLTKKRYATFQELKTYCYHVAGTIGLMCNELFGVCGRRANDYAILLGTAFQLTNILRDVGSDARRGRIYLPLEDLRKFRVSSSFLLKGRHVSAKSSSFHELMQFEALRAESYFQKAYATLPLKIRKKILPAQIMSSYYHRILHKMMKEKFPVFEKKVGLEKSEKVFLLLTTLLKSLL